MPMPPVKHRAVRCPAHLSRIRITLSSLGAAKKKTEQLLACLLAFRWRAKLSNQRTIRAHIRRNATTEKNWIFAKSIDPDLLGEKKIITSLVLTYLEHIRSDSGGSFLGGFGLQSTPQRTVVATVDVRQVELLRRLAAGRCPRSHMGNDARLLDSGGRGSSRPGKGLNGGMRLPPENEPPTALGIYAT